jgi:uncharacterized membrane protein
MFDLPVHPIFVHFPVALLTLAWLLLVLHHWTGRERQRSLAWSLEVIGILTLPITIITGMIDTGGISFLTSPRWDLPLVWHFLTASAGAVVFAGHGIWRYRTQRAGSMVAATWDLGLVTAGFWLILFAGLLAGELVYGT